MEAVFVIDMYLKNRLQCYSSSYVKLMHIITDMRVCVCAFFRRVHDKQCDKVSVTVIAPSQPSTESTSLTQVLTHLCTCLHFDCWIYSLLIPVYCSFLLKQKQKNLRTKEQTIVINSL